MALELINRDIGRKTRVMEKTISVGTTVTKILENNPNRIMLVIQNTGSATAYIGLTNTVSSSSGLMLGANGGFITLLWKEDGELLIREYYAIAIGTTILYILELVVE